MKKIIALQIEKELADKLKKEAKEKEMSLSGYIRYLIKKNKDRKV